MQLYKVPNCNAQNRRSYISDDLIDIDCELKRIYAKSILIDDGRREVLLQIEGTHIDHEPIADRIKQGFLMHGEQITVNIPQWMAYERGLI